MNYNLFNDDCLKAMDRLISEGVVVDCIIADPPYGGTDNTWDSPIDVSSMWRRLKSLVKINGTIVLFGQGRFAKILGASNIKDYRYEWIWIKEQGTGHFNSVRAPLKQHENILVFFEKQGIYNPQLRYGFKPYYSQGNDYKSANYRAQPRPFSVSKSEFGERQPIDVLYFTRDKPNIHPTQKPVKLLEHLIQTYTNEGETVLDFVMGSGTTGVACKHTNRNFIGIEGNKEYFDLSNERMEEAILAKTVNGYKQSTFLDDV